MTTEVYHPAARSHPVPTQSFVLSLCMTRGIVDFDSLELEHDAHQRPVPVLQVEVDVELARRLQEHWPLGRAESSCAFQDAMRIYLRKRVQHTNTYSLSGGSTTSLFYRDLGVNLGARWGWLTRGGRRPWALLKPSNDRTGGTIRWSLERGVTSECSEDEIRSFRRD